MAIDALIKVATPPRQPLEGGSLEEWEPLQQRLKLALPDDLRDFGIHFGSGKFVNLGLVILNPFARHYLDGLESAVSVWRSLKSGEGDREVPFEVFPKSPGLLPWGTDENGCGLFWLTDGNPVDWPIVLRAHESPDYERFEMSLTTFLAKAFTREIKTPVWRATILKKKKSFQFQPIELSSPQTLILRSLMDLYKENGNRTGFWVQFANEIGSNTIQLVKLINGISSGDLPDPKETPVVQVIADVFEDGKKVVTDYQFPTDMAADAFQHANPPA